MSALAMILRDRGYSVSGSDKKSLENLKHLKLDQIKIFHKQTEQNICEIQKNKSREPLIVISSAIENNNEELQAARRAGLQVIHRSDLLAGLIRAHKSVVVAGSHGKTTTSTLITTLLALAKQDPTAVIGGLVPYYQSNGHAGTGDLLIAEGDESDGTIAKFEPSLGVITNLELEHIDYYENLDELIVKIKKFSVNCKELIANYDCPNLMNNFKPKYWWSIKKTKQIDFAAEIVCSKKDKFIVNYFERGVFIDQIEILIPGVLNLSNTIGAIGACRILGISFKEIKNSLHLLKTPARRFELKGTWKGRQIIDDYAHHPTEIDATIEIALNQLKEKQKSVSLPSPKLIAVFQPHRFTRTKQFLKEFALSLEKANKIILTPVYAAGENFIENADSNAIKKEICKIKPNSDVIVAEDLNQATDLIKSKSNKNDIVLMIGAGNINTIWNLLNDTEVSHQCLENKKAA